MILRIAKALHQAGNRGQPKLNSKAPEAIQGLQMVVNGRNHEGMKSELKCLK
jgi:hypothetical protein